MVISLLLKVFGISLFVFVSIFLFTTHLQAYIQLDFSDIDYDEAQYIKFIIDADKNFDIFLYMKDNDNNTFRVHYQTENDVDTGDYKDGNDDDELAIFLDEDEYVTGHNETFNSFTHGNSLSLDEYINTHWEEREYNGGSAELEKIRIYGDEFKLYYIAIDDGDFSDPTWEIDVSDEDWDNLDDFENDGHSLPDFDQYSNTITNIAFLDDCIHITTDFIPGVGYEALRYPGGFYGGYPGYGYSPWTYYGGNTGYFPPGSIYSPSGWNQPYNYQPFPNFSNWNWTSPTTAYNPSFGGGMVFVSWPEGGAWQSPYYQQTNYYPWNQPYSYGWNQPSYNPYQWYQGPYSFISDNPWGPSPYWNTPFGHVNFGQDWITTSPSGNLMYQMPNGSYYDPITGTIGII